MRITKDGDVQQKLAYECRRIEDVYFPIDNVEFIELNDEMKIITKIGTYMIMKHEDNSYLEHLSNEEYFYSYTANYSDSILWPDHCLVSDTIVVDGSLWLHNHDKELYHVMDEELELKYNVENPYKAYPNDTIIDTVSDGNNLYFLTHNEFAGLCVRVTDRLLNTLFFAELNTVKSLSNIIMGENSISVFTLSNMEYNGESISYSIVENIVDQNGLVEKEVVWSNHPDLLNNSVWYSLMKKDAIVYKCLNRVYTYDLISGEIYFINLEEVFTSASLYELSFFGVNSDNQITLIFQKYYESTDELIKEVEKVLIRKYTNDFTLIDEMEIPIYGEYNQKLSNVYMASNDDIYIGYVGNF